MKKVYKKITLAIVSSFLLLPLFALAAGSLIPPAPKQLSGSVIGQPSRFTIVALYVIDIALGVVGIISVAFIIWGGFRYVTSAGNEEVAENAKKVITNAIIGIVVVILAYVIISTIINALVYNAT